MKNTKTEWRFFSVPEWKREEAYLREQHERGWEYLQDDMGYSYFRKPTSEMEGTEAIFCDDASRLEMMRRVFKGRMIPLLIVFFLIIIPQMMRLSRMDTPFRRGFMLFFCAMFVLYGWIFISFAIAYWKYSQSVHRD